MFSLKIGSIQISYKNYEVTSLMQDSFKNLYTRTQRVVSVSDPD